MIVDLSEYQTQIAVVVGVVLPLIVALVTKQLASSRLKNTVLLGLSAVTALIVPLSVNPVLDVSVFTQSFLTIFGTSVLAYLGVYKPQGTTATIQDKTSQFGVGSNELPDITEYEDVEVVDASAVDGPTLEG